MKKTFRFIGLVIVAALVGFVAMCIAIAFDASDKVAIVSYFGVAAIVAVAMGVFKFDERKVRHMSIEEGASSIRRAA